MNGLLYNNKKKKLLHNDDDSISAFVFTGKDSAHGILSYPYPVCFS